MQIENARIPFNARDVRWKEGKGIIHQEGPDATRMVITLEPNARQEIITQTYNDNSGRTIIHTLSNETPRTIDGLHQLAEAFSLLHEAHKKLQSSQAKGTVTDADIVALEAAISRFSKSKKSSGYGLMVYPDAGSLTVSVSSDPDDPIAISTKKLVPEEFQIRFGGDRVIPPTSVESQEYLLYYGGKLTKVDIKADIHAFPFSPEKYTDAKTSLQQQMQVIEEITREDPEDPQKYSKWDVVFKMIMTYVKSFCEFTEEDLLAATNLFNKTITTSYNIHEDSRLFTSIQSALQKGGLQWVLAEFINKHGIEEVTNNLGKYINQWTVVLKNYFLNREEDIGVIIESSDDGDAYSWKSYRQPRNLTSGDSVLTGNKGIIGRQRTVISEDNYQIEINPTGDKWEITVSEGDKILRRRIIPLTVSSDDVTDVVADFDKDIHKLGAVIGVTL